MATTVYCIVRDHCVHFNRLSSYFVTWSLHFIRGGHSFFLSRYRYLRLLSMSAIVLFENKCEVLRAIAPFAVKPWPLYTAIDSLLLFLALDRANSHWLSLSLFAIPIFCWDLGYWEIPHHFGYSLSAWKWDFALKKRDRISLHLLYLSWPQWTLAD